MAFSLGRASLRFRIFIGLVACLLIAGLSGLIAERLLRSDDLEHPARTTARTIQTSLEAAWDDESQRSQVLQNARKATGLDLSLIEDRTKLPPPARRALRRETITFGKNGQVYIPISKNGDVVALVLYQAPTGKPGWDALIVLTVVLLALAILAYALSKRLTSPLEAVATAARQFGEGRLNSRAGSGAQAGSREVADVGASFDQMAARIEHLVLDQRALLQAISHELRSPLGRALLGLEIAKDRSEPKAHAALLKVEQELGAVDAILGDLLLSARSGLSELHKQDHDVNAWLTSFQEAQNANNVSLQFEALPHPLSASFDEKLITLALSNLIRNAYQYGHPKQTPLMLRVSSDEKTVRFALYDAGSGFAPGLLQKAFEPFVRGDAARSPTGGTGLGLSLVKRIAEAHGGSAGAENTKDSPVGAMVWITLARA
jgi:two-component system, OmpR family, sensor kinase